MPTKRFFNAIAERYHRVFKNLPEEGNDASRVFDTMVVGLADVLEESNQRFDRDRFFTAIYLPKTRKGDLR